MINFKITIGRKIFAIKATKDDQSLSSKVMRTPIGIQSGLFRDENFSEDKMLYEKRQRRENRPRMIVEQLEDQANNAVLLPGIDRENVFRPLWVTVPVENEEGLTGQTQPVNMVRSITNIKKFLSVFKTWFSYQDDLVTRNVSLIQKNLSKYFQFRTIIRYRSIPDFSLQPALFDASPVASMEKARYIASRESFSDRGILPGASWRFPTIKFVLSVPRKNRTSPEVLSPVLSQHVAQIPSRQTNTDMQRKSSSFFPSIPETVSLYFLGFLAVGAGVFINFFLLH